jgi:hypothetical protein
MDGIHRAHVALKWRYGSGGLTERQKLVVRGITKAALLILIACPGAEPISSSARLDRGLKRLGEIWRRPRRLQAARKAFADIENLKAAVLVLSGCGGRSHSKHWQLLPYASKLR